MLDKIFASLYNIYYRGVAQFGRVLGLGPRCRRFESCHLDQIKFVDYCKISANFIFFGLKLILYRGKRK